MKRTDVLALAEKTICQDRQDQYGSAEDCFSDIANFWATYLNTPVTALDVSVMMNLLKVARIKANPKHYDNYTDAIGYMALAVEMVNE